MLTAKRAGARLGYLTPLQQRAVPIQRDKAAERQDNKTTRQQDNKTTKCYILNSKLYSNHVGKLPKKPD
jgi:hypothetical protein